MRYRKREYSFVAYFKCQKVPQLPLLKAYVYGTLHMKILEIYAQKKTQVPKRQLFKIQNKH